LITSVLQHVGDVAISAPNREGIDHRSFHFGIRISFRHGRREIEAVHAAVGRDFVENILPDF
jgi:hypothetical protein